MLIRVEEVLGGPTCSMLKVSLMPSLDLLSQILTPAPQGSFTGLAKASSDVQSSKHRNSVTRTTLSENFAVVLPQKSGSRVGCSGHKGLSKDAGAVAGPAAAACRRVQPRTPFRWPIMGR